MKPTITITTDGSYYNPYNLGAWACYIRTPSKVVKVGAIIKQKISKPQEAERMGLANALYIVDGLVDLGKYRLIIYCDCIDALHKSKINVTPKSKYYEQQKIKADWYEANIDRIINKADTVERRHVKGHLSKDRWDKNSAKNFMNDWCDKEAKRLLRNEKRKIKSLENKTK